MITLLGLVGVLLVFIMMSGKKSTVLCLHVSHWIITIDIGSLALLVRDLIYVWIDQDFSCHVPIGIHWNLNKIRSFLEYFLLDCFSSLPLLPSPINGVGWYEFGNVTRWWRWSQEENNVEIELKKQNEKLDTMISLLSEDVDGEH